MASFSRIKPLFYLRAQTGLFALTEQASPASGSSKPGNTFVRGIKARGEIAEDDILFAVPPSLLVNVALVHEDAHLAPVYHNISAMRDGVSGLAVWLLREAMNKSSEWRPYLCSLPKVTCIHTCTYIMFERTIHVHIHTYMRTCTLMFGKWPLS